MVAGAVDWAEEGAAPQGALRRWLDRAWTTQEGRAFLWAPVCLTFGIWSYFGLTQEPSRIAVAVVGLFGLGLLWLGRHRPAWALLALLLIGFALAKARSDWVATPLLTATTPEVLITGTVTEVRSSGPRRQTVLLAPERVEGLTSERTPRLLRFSSFEKFGMPGIGQRVAIKARLAPLPAPVEPGGFDYGRRLWFEGIGGTGRVAAPITVLGDARPWRYWLDARLAGLRRTMGERIAARLDGTLAAFAEALITGERATIPKEVNRSLLVSGLFHVLSISGLHMWLVAGGVFWTVRAALALVPVLALRYPIKKWAAVSAILMGLFYMLLADSGVATQRSFIMIAVVFFAVLVDRPALSTRNLAIAAMAVLLLEPEAAIEASFQMSFLAVLGIVAFAEFWSDFRVKRDKAEMQHQGLAVTAAKRLAATVFLALMTSLIAGAMSSIPAAYHFGRLAPYGLIANGLALPVIGFVVMPAALCAAVVMPLGLEALPLYVMGQGLHLVMVISDWVAGFPGAYVVVQQPPAAAMILLAAGAAVFCLLAGPARVAGPALAAAGMLLAIMPQEKPDLLIERTGANLALRSEAGNLIPALPRKARFSVEKWLQTNGEESVPAEAAKRPGWTCSKARCDATIKGKRLAYIFDAETAALDCTGLDILVASFPLRRRCPSVAVRIDRFDLWRSGAHALYIAPGAIHVATARGEQGARPWVVVPEPRKDKFKRP